jgi:hypothetical protein
MGGSGGFAKGGAIGMEHGGGDSREPSEGSRTAFRHGGAVGGGDSKPRYKGTVHK